MSIPNLTKEPMKLKDIILNIDKSSRGDVDIDKVAEEFGMCGDFMDQYCGIGGGKRLQAYFYVKWYCTDTVVGGRVYFLDNEPVAVSWQDGRKSDENFDWIDKESVHKYLLSLSSDMVEFDNDEIDMDEELGDGHTVEYSGQLLTKEVIYNGERVTVTKEFQDYVDIDNWSHVEIEVDGISKLVKMSEILVPYCVNK